MQAFILLALNGGLGPGDIGQMEPRHMVGRWVHFPRPKTLVDRSFPLWSKTAEAIRDARQTKHPDQPFLFTTKYGQPWYRDAKVSPLTQEFRKLCQRCGAYQKGRGFYALRHQFRTVADGSRDTVAINHIMGHVDSSMGDVYREWIEPDRLHAVVDHVKEWLAPMFRSPQREGGGA